MTRDSRSQPATSEARAKAFDYIVGHRSDLHPMFGGCPNIRDLCYTVFMHARCGTNSEDGGPNDWVNDTVPMVERAITEFQKMAALPLPEATGGREDRRLEDEELGQQVRAVALEECAEIALAIDSGRGNEKEIAKAIRALAHSSTNHSPPDLKATQNTAESDPSVRSDCSGGETHD